MSHSDKESPQGELSPSTPPTTTLQNDQLSVVLTKQPHCQVTFDIKVSPSATAAAYHKALKNINKEVSIPGFRKGKAPDSFLLEKYASAVQREFIDIVLQTGFDEAVRLTHCYPLKEGYMQRPIVHSCQPNKEAHFTITFESRPAIPAIDLADLRLNVLAPPPITPEDHRNALHNLLLQFATYEPVEDRPVQEDDFIDVSLKLLTEPPQTVMHQQRIQAKTAELPSWISKPLFNLRANQSVQGMTEPSPDAPQTSESDFQAAPFELTVHAIWKGSFPEVNDELAQRVKCPSVDQLHQKIDEHLEQAAQEETFQLNARALERLLIERYAIDLPQSYIDSNKKARLENLFGVGSKERGSPPERQHLENQIEQQVIRDLSLFFLMQKIAHTYHIEVNEEDVFEELKRQALLTPQGKNSVDLSGAAEQRRQQLQHLALDRKIKQFVLEQITLTDPS